MSEDLNEMYAMHIIVLSFVVLNIFAAYVSNYIIYKRVT